MRRAALCLCVAAAVVLAGCPLGAQSAGNPSPTATPSGTGSAESTPTDAGTPMPTATATAAPTATATATPPSDERAVHPPDPATDRLGWENGRWYNETVPVDPSDGLNDTELAAVVNRTMARVEVVRKLEFERTVPVEIVPRSEYRNRSSNYTVSTANRIHQNVKWEAMLMVNESADAIAVRQTNSGATTGGYYSPSEDRIVVVSENATTPKLDEITLSQELFHALQDRKFDVASFDQRTQELHNAKDGIVEGDANLVDRRYRQRCRKTWDCLMPQSSGGGGSGSADIHFGMYLVTYQPYSDGPKFVRGIYRREGWDGVNAVYDNPPASTEQTIHPEKYPEDEPTDVTVTDTSNEEWRILEMGPNSIDYAAFGEAGLATMLFYPFYDSGRTRAPVVSPRRFFNFTASGDISSFDPINYSTRYTDGWDGDKLYPYVNGSSAETNETGYVWKTVWDSAADAADFEAGYTRLLEYYDARAVDGREDTYRIPEGNDYADAFWVHREGDVVYIVNAPGVDALGEVRAEAGG